MFDNLQSQLGKLLGKREEDPQATITADQLKVVLKSIEGKYNNLKNENKTFKITIEEQKATIGELERVLGELKSSHAPGETARLSLLESDLAGMLQQLTEQREASETLRTEKLQLQSKLSVQEALVTSLRQELEEQRENPLGALPAEEHVRLEADNARLLEENQRMKAQLEASAAQLAEAGKAAADIEDLHTRLDEARQTVNTLKGQIEGLETEREQWQDKVSLGEELTGLQSRLKVLQSERDELVSEREALKGEVEALQAHAAQREEEVAQMQQDHTQAITQLERDRDEQVTQLQQDKDEMRFQVQRQQGELQRLEQQAAEGGPQGEVIAELEERLLQAKAKLEQAGEENQALQGRLQAMVNEPGMGARERTEMEFQIKRLSDELREGMLQISALREAKVKANLDLEEAAGELVELRRQLDDMRRDRNFYRERWEAAREALDELETLKQQVREMSNELSRLQKPAVTLKATPPIEEPAPEAAPQAKVEVPTGSLARRREMLNRLISDQR